MNRHLLSCLAATSFLSFAISPAAAAPLRDSCDPTPEMLEYAYETGDFGPRDTCAITLCFLDKRLLPTWAARYCVCDFTEAGYPSEVALALCGIARTNGPDRGRPVK